jgi:hypothetical protein
MKAIYSKRVPRAVCAIACGIITANASADVGITYANGGFAFPSEPLFYLSASGSSIFSSLQGYSFGPINTSIGESLVLRNFYLGNFAVTGDTSTNYIDASSTALLMIAVAQGGAIIHSQNYALQRTTVNSGYHNWDLGSATDINLTAGLGGGDYTVSMRVAYTYFTVTGATLPDVGLAQTTIVTSNFAVVPASGSFALLGAAAGLIGRRRRS